MTKIIVDACNNHLGNEDLIKELIRSAKFNGADYIKFQLYNPEKLNRLYPNYEEYYARCKRYMIDEKKLSIILETCEKHKIVPAFTIFSKDRIEFLLKSLKCQYEEKNKVLIKIASPDMSNADLIENCRKKFPNNKIVISTGMHSENEITKIRKKFKREDSFKYLYCISKYPTPEHDIDIAQAIQSDGFSDHTISINIAKELLRYKVEYIEIHYTLSKNIPSIDKVVSKTPDQLLELVGHRVYLDNILKYKMRWTNGK